MNDMITYVNDFVKSIRPHETIASFVREKTKNSSIGEGRPSEYFYLRELCNPIQSYYTRIGKSIPPSLESKKKMAYGNKLHRLANIWFRDIPGYIVDEGVVDGALVNVKGVRGKIDALMGENILEIKTKENLPGKDPSEIIENYLQDVEQLVFYSVLYKKPKEINYLIFISQKHPHDLLSFKIKVKNPHLIKEVIRSRIKRLEKAIGDKNPSSLPKCKYHEVGCHLKDLCSCEDLKDFADKKVLENIEIFYDGEFSEKLRKFKENSQGFLKEEDVFTTHDILFPRNYRVEEEYAPDEEKDQLKNYLEGLVRKIHEFRILPSGNEFIKKSLKEPKMAIKHRWIRIPSSNTKTDYFPYIVTMNKTGSARPHEYHTAALGLICALYGKNKGVIFEITPDEKIRVFDVEYRNTSKILNRIKEIIKNIQEEKIEELPPNHWN